MKFDEKWEIEDESKIPDIMQNTNLLDNEAYTADFHLDEVEVATHRLKKGTAPCLDGFSAEMFINGGDELRIARLLLFNLCWRQGRSP